MKGDSQRVTIHQFHYNASSGDAVCSQMRLIQSALKKVGVSGNSYAEEIHPDVTDFFLPLDERELWNADLVLVHHSQGNRALKKLLAIEVPKAVVYHNITPEAFVPHDPLQASLCRLGRAQLPLFKDFAGHFADSAFNLAELESLGIDGGEILPLLDLENRPELGAKMRRSKSSEPLKLLFVGRVTPHKNQAALLKVLYYLSVVKEIPAKLTLVGRGHPLYVAYLKSLARLWGVEKNLEVTGPVSEARLTTLYRSADLFVSLSLHEGFCIPLVEAMQHDVPVISTTVTGMGATLGEAGIQLQDDEPSEVAEVIATIAKDSELLSTVVESQREQLTLLSQVQNEATIQRLCLGLVRRLRSAPAPQGPRPETSATI